jgi:hypothetical protein
MNETTVLYRLISSGEMELIRSVNYGAFPPRLFWKQTFHPVSNEEYATQMARTWNLCDGKPVYLIRFQVRTDFLQPYEAQIDGEGHKEYRIPSDGLEELDELERNMVGNIEVLSEFHAA